MEKKLDTNSTASTILFLFVFAAALTAISVYFSSLNFAATSENNDLSASLTVNAFVDTSIVNSTVTFGSLDPGNTFSASTTNPIELTNTANSNTAIDVYLNNTNMTAGVLNISYGNLSVMTFDSATSANVKNFTGTGPAGLYINGTSANNGFRENMAVSSSVNLYFWQGVPGGQGAGSYTATVRIHSVVDGATP